VRFTSLGKRIYRDELKLEHEEEDAAATGSTDLTPASRMSPAPTSPPSLRDASP